MKNKLHLAGALLLAAGLSTSAAQAGGHHGGGNFGGGGHAVAHSMPHFAARAPVFHPQTVRVAPHFQNHVVRNFSNEGHEHHGHHRHHGRFLVYSSLYDYDNSYYDRGGCGWLWQRYLNTGNPHWKHRYYECIE